MMDEQWKELLAEAQQRGVKSPYTERLKTAVRARDLNASLAGEILEEMGSSLARAGARIDAALLTLDLLALQIDESPERGGAREALIASFNEGREQAERARRDLQIQREAIGFRDNRLLAQLYPIPPRRHG